MKKAFFLFLAGIAVIFGENTPDLKSPEDIQLEINQAQTDFEIAQKMFIPWYTGPLITSSANNVAPGHFNIQTYLYLTVNHAQFNAKRQSISAPNSYVISPLVVLQAGLTSWLDMTLIPQVTFKWQSGEFASNFNDLSLTFGFQLARETIYFPNMRLFLGESFPTGKYNNLDPKKTGLDAMGSGAFQTTLGMTISKIFWWLKLHPIATRLSGSFSVADHKANVTNFNAYGGTYGTDGKVQVGNTLNLDLGLEFSLTQRWVFATDIVYTASSKSSFSGTKGITPLGLPAEVGAPSSDSFSLSPAIEYNVTDTQGFIGGIWFPLTGRNSANFVTLMLSYTAYF